MDKEMLITRAYENAKAVYTAYGVNVESVLEKFDTIPVSISFTRSFRKALPFNDRHDACGLYQ